MTRVRWRASSSRWTVSPWTRVQPVEVVEAVEVVQVMMVDITGTAAAAVSRRHHGP